jgi:glutamate transport system permease protein
MSGASFLGDDLGPRGRRRVLVASVISAVAFVGLVLVVLDRLGDRGQLEGDRWSRFWGYRGFLWDGLYATLRLAFTSMALAFAAGLVLGLLRLSRRWPVRWLAATWIEVFRGIPLVLLMLFLVLATDYSAFWAAGLALVLYNSAVLAEIVRSGVLSLDRGQRQAAEAIGLSEAQAMRLVVLPQALRRMVPALISQLITLLKDTSLASIVAYEGLLRRFQLSAKPNLNKAGQSSAELQAYVFCAVVYILVNLSLSLVARRLEVRQRRRYRAGGISVTGVEGLIVVEGAGNRP